MAILHRKVFSLKEKKTQKGFTVIEVLTVVVIIAILILIGIWAYRQQLAKGRDGLRKADLAKMQRVLEDYLNDHSCYPDSFLTCGSTAGTEFEGYIAEIPCDPVNSPYYHYLYTYNTVTECPKWYKIYTKLENESDEVILQVGCEGGCGPSDNYSYWAASPNVTEVDQLENEYWPDIPLPPLELDPNCGSTCPLNCVPSDDLFPGCCGSCCDGNLYRCDPSVHKCLYDPNCQE